VYVTNHRTLLEKGCSVVDTSKLKGKKKRKARQRNVKNFMELREDLQLDGRIPTTPEGAIRDERVDPVKQSEQQFPALVETAVRNGWATPDHIKPKIVDALIEPFLKRDTIVTADGDTIEIPPDRNLLKENAKVLAMVDKMQYERDHPDETPDTTINNNVNVVSWDRMQQPPQVTVDNIEQRIANVKQEVKDQRQDGGDAKGQPVQGQGKQ
jgi:hypothetical protein